MRPRNISSAIAHSGERTSKNDADRGGCRRRHDSLQQAGRQPDLQRDGRRGGQLALADAGIGYDSVQQAYVGYVYGDSTCGQRALYEVGMTGIPIVNVNNNCSTGSTALFLARQAVASGAVDCVLALGFEQMQAGRAGRSLGRPALGPFERFNAGCRRPGRRCRDCRWRCATSAAPGREHMQRYGTKLETFAKIRAKASRHAANNPLALFRKVVTDRRSDGPPGDLARRDDAPDGLPADLRRGRGDHRARRPSRRSTACAPTCASWRRP